MSYFACRLASLFLFLLLLTPSIIAVPFASTVSSETGLAAMPELPSNYNTFYHRLVNGSHIVHALPDDYDWTTFNHSSLPPSRTVDSTTPTITRGTNMVKKDTDENLIDHPVLHMPVPESFYYQPLETQLPAIALMASSVRRNLTCNPPPLKPYHDSHLKNVAWVAKSFCKIHATKYSPTKRIMRTLHTYWNARGSVDAEDFDDTMNDVYKIIVSDLGEKCSPLAMQDEIDMLHPIGLFVEGVEDWDSRNFCDTLLFQTWHDCNQNMGQGGSIITGCLHWEFRPLNTKKEFEDAGQPLYAFNK